MHLTRHTGAFWSLALAWGIILGAQPLNAQTNVSTSPTLTDSDSSGRIVSSDQIDYELKADDPTQVDANSLQALRATRAQYPKLSLEIRKKLLAFQRQRLIYMKEQEALIKKFRGATDAERDKIRERLQNRRIEWMEQSRSYRESARERLRDLRNELPKHREALDAARESLQDQVKETLQDEVREIRKRPRTD